MRKIDIELTTNGALVAPAAIWLRAINPTGFNVGEPTGGEPYDPSYHDITYIWSVRGQPIAPFRAPQNMVDGWNNPNLMYGKHVAFCLPDVGTYDIDLWCVDSEGTTGEATLQIKVAAPVYPGVNTIVVALDGDFTGAPASTAQVTSLAALETSLRGRSDPTRVSFKPGETINKFRLAPRNGNLALVDTWVSGAKVILQTDYIGPYEANGFQFDDECPSTEITWRDIRLQGTWDPTTETGDTGNSSFWLPPISQRCNFLLYDCEFSGLAAVQLTLPDNNGVTGCRLVMADCVIENWRGYGFTLFPNGDSRGLVALLGSRLTQHPRALAGGPKSDMQNDHGCTRVQNAQHLIMSCNDMFTTSGWSGWPPNANAANRLHTSVQPNSSTVFERNVVEGGYTKIKLDGQNDAQREFPGNHVIERNVLIGTARTLLFARMNYGGTTFRNNLLYMPDVDVFDNILGEFLYIDPDDNPDPTNNDAPFVIYNNTFVSRESAGMRPHVGGPIDYWSELIIENNVHYALGQTQDTLDFSTPLRGVTPRYKELRFNFLMHVTSLLSDVMDGSTVNIPFASLDRSTGFTHPTLVTGSTAPTNQAYWQALPASDNLHMMRISSGQVLHAARGQFTVDYDSDPAHIVITNTSGMTWPSGRWEMRLDRKSQLDFELPAATSYANPPNIPVCTRLIAPEGVTLGKLATHDFFGNRRTQPVASGAFED